jgi:monoamine oxidase
MTPDDQQRLVRFLVIEGYLDSADRRYKAFANRGPGDPYQLTALLQGNFTRGIRSVPQAEGTQAAPMFQPIGGMDEIWKAGARAIGPNRITMNAAVQQVRQDEHGATVIYKIFGGHLYSDLPLGEFSYPSTGYFSKKGVLLGLYSNGQYGELLDKPISERIEHVLLHSSKVHPQIRQEFESAYAVWWKKVEYSRGGYASAGSAERRGRLAKMDNRLLIGSAATAPFSQPDWQEGAVAAAWQALTTVHEQAMKGSA